MRILYLFHTSSFYQGSSKSMLNTIENLKQKEIVPYVLLPRQKDDSLCEQLDLRGIPYSFVPLSWPVYPAFNTLADRVVFLPKLFKTWFNKIFATLRILRFVKREKIDIIHTNVGILSEGFWAAQICKLPHVWHLREFQDLDFKLNTFYSLASFRKRLRKPNNYPIAISREIARHFNLGDDSVIYNGILSKNAIRFNPDKEKYILFVGLLSAGKGVESVINTFSRFHVKYQDYRLKIVGDTNDNAYKLKLISLVESLEMTKYVDFVGHVSDVSAVMYKATLLVVPSRYEAFGRVTVEALYNGCFVLGRNTGGTKEILQQTGGGMLFNDDDKLFDQLVEVFEKGLPYYYSAIKEAQQKIGILYSTEGNADQMFERYRSILKGQINQFID